MNETDATNQRARLARYSELTSRLDIVQRTRDQLVRIEGDLSRHRNVTGITLHLSSKLHPTDRNPGHEGSRIINEPLVTDYQLREFLLPIVEKRMDEIKAQIAAI